MEVNYENFLNVKKAKIKSHVQIMKYIAASAESPSPPTYRP